MSDTPKVPFINPNDITSTPTTFEPVGVCPKCGLQFERVMSYCCPNYNCPTGLGTPTC